MAAAPSESPSDVDLVVRTREISPVGFEAEAGSVYTFAT